MILDGKLSMGHARELSKLEDNDKIVEYAKNIVNNDLSVRDVENLSKSTEVKKKNPINRVHKDNEYDYVERKLKEVFGTKVRVDGKKIEISFDNNNDFFITSEENKDIEKTTEEKMAKYQALLGGFGGGLF